MADVFGGEASKQCEIGEIVKLFFIYFDVSQKFAKKIDFAHRLDAAALLGSRQPCAVKI